jgi:DNA-binding CsgD family transcriptional regulator
MSTFGEDAYFALVQSIYETILNPHEWDKVVAETINITQASTAAIVGFRGPDDRRVSGFSKGITKASLCSPQVVSALHACTLTAGQGAVVNLDLKTRVHSHRDISLHECFGNEGTLLVLVIMKEAGRQISLLAHFNRANRSEIERATEALMKLLPHFQTAFAVQKVAMLERERSSQMESAFFSSPVPSAIITADYQVHLANAGFEKFAEASHQLIEYRDSVLDIVNSELRDVIARLIAMSLQHGRRRHIACAEDRSKSVKWLVSVDALSGRSAFGAQFKSVFASSDPVFMLTIRELGRNTLLQPDIIKSIFGLTSTEADLAHSLLNGETASEIAHQRGVSKNTIHNQLSSAMARIGVNRQTQFMHCLAELSSFTS